MTNDAAVLEVEDLVKHFPAGRGLIASTATVHAVDGVSFSLREGEMLGLVGESGSGKTTLANCVVRLHEPTSGAVRLRGRDITHLSRRELRPLRRDLHMVFQDPYSSLNPRMTAGEIVAEPLRLHKLAGRKVREQRVLSIFERVGLGPEHRFRYPHELSGGQRQRVGLARSLILNPSVLIADEPVSALDVSVQASILNLLRDLQRDMGFSCLFITHDLATVEFLCDRIAVMYLGKLVEVASRDAIFSDPQHPYTQALLSAAVVPDPEQQRQRRRVVLEGDPPSPLAPPSGCRFHTRCPLHHLSAPESDETEPPLREVAPGHLVACHLVGPGSRAPRIADPPDAVGVADG
ncbi:MAG TPA: oligopeptide/dipeptide ABC transporter ATP-binding protein [Gaiellaceae bacterium]|nr:oligopeptide/dipeptide ABC transporter ATP-binding protein [Gaiellaceae bacterium]